MVEEGIEAERGGKYLKSVDELLLYAGEYQGFADYSVYVLKNLTLAGKGRMERKARRYLITALFYNRSPNINADGQLNHKSFDCLR
jgi:hypothetical protein